MTAGGFQTTRNGETEDRAKFVFELLKYFFFFFKMDVGEDKPGSAIRRII